jgi:cysteine-rich repeat protein
MQRITTVSCALAAALVGGCQGLELDETTQLGQIDGAIFTTLSDGSRVNHNIYADKDDVYLDGGPGDGAPQHAAALPDGDYYFQVTDPSGKTLLSTDAITEREITIDDGIIVAASGHETSLDVDHGALTVQLMPYLDTPNNGGEYKVWITPVEYYTSQPGRGAKHGFIPRFSKTDNFKIRELDVEEPPPPPLPYCGDGNVDAGEVCDDGNDVNGDGCDANCTLTPPPPPPPCCGDGHVDAGEECDDGNTTDGDGCSSVCLIQYM